MDSPIHNQLLEWSVSTTWPEWLLGGEKFSLFIYVLEEHRPVPNRAGHIAAHNKVEGEFVDPFALDTIDFGLDV